MDQATFAELEHDGKKRTTRRERFLAKMDGLIPWEALERRVEPHYPKPGRGRRPYPLGTMLRVHCVQLFYDPGDPGMEDLLYGVESVRRFAGLRLTGPLPDETTILKFRHLLEKHGLGGALFGEINAHLASLGHRLKTGTIVDASIVDAPSSTKNKAGERDPEMRRTKKGNQWYFGMKAHIGVDSESGLTHTLATTSANGSDVAHACLALHGEETQVWGDAGYQGVGKRPENRDAEVEWRVAMKPGRRRKLDKAGAQEAAEKRKASVRAKVEHPFLYVKRHFGYGKAGYRGLAKNTRRIAMLLGFANLLIAGRHAAAWRGARAPGCGENRRNGTLGRPIGAWREAGLHRQTLGRTGGVPHRRAHRDGQQRRGKYHPAADAEQQERTVRRPCPFCRTSSRNTLLSRLRGPPLVEPINMLAHGTCHRTSPVSIAFVVHMLTGYATLTRVLTNFEHL